MPYSDDGGIREMSRGRESLALYGDLCATLRDQAVLRGFRHAATSAAAPIKAAYARSPLLTDGRDLEQLSRIESCLALSRQSGPISKYFRASKIMRCSKRA